MSKRSNRVLALVMAVVTMFGSINLAGFSASAAPNYVTAKRVAEQSTIYVDEEAEITLQVTGTPPVDVVKPNDVVLVLDKSGSMLEDNRFDAMIESAKEFIDLVEFDAHQVGIVDYSGNGQVSSYPLTTDSTDLKTYLDQIVCGGGTYTHDAIYKGMEVLEQGREDAQPVMILLTDGQAKNDDWAMEAATAAKEAGIVFYTIALLAPDEDPAASLRNMSYQKMSAWESSMD